jgi:Protein of unknown function (DUF732)
MATHRRSGRFAGLAAISGPLVVAGIVGAGPARADAASYLSDLHNAGIRDVGGDSALLQTGQKLCVQLSYGVTSDQLTALAVQRSDAREAARGLTPLQASELVNYAIADLCPNY